MATRETSKFWGDGLLLNIHIPAWSGSISLTPEDMGLDAKKVPKAFKLGVKMLVPDKVIKDLRYWEGKARRAADFPYGLNFPIGSSRFVPKDNISKVIEILKDCREHYLALARSLSENLEQYREQMLPVYRQAAETAFIQLEPEGVTEFNMEEFEAKKSAFVEAFLTRIKSYYPTPEAILTKYDIVWDAFEIGQSTGDYATEELRAQTQAKLDAFVEDVVAQLRSETVNVCTRISQSIKEGKVITNKSITALRSFVEKFQNLNFVGDTRIDDELKALKAEFLTTSTTEQLSSPEMQVQLKERLASIASAASDISDISAISGTYKRKIVWKDESASE